mmetsp:Transcript_14750/g.36831  ORF Transcript_14750/g.36831 Transcript_14750/m.36831 type:complete len:1168 (-) Transcript_14750:409-3912(-)
MQMGDGSAPYIAYEEALLKPQPPTTPRNPSSRTGSEQQSCWRYLCCCCRRREPEARKIKLNAERESRRRFPPNVVVNTKYSFFFFLPKVLYEQFRYFQNLYFLLVALSQIFPPLQIGLLFTYIAPLVFVLAVTMIKEAIDDLLRFRMDREINRQQYLRLLPNGSTESVCSKDLRVGHIVRVHTNERVPADLVLLRTSEPSGMVFLRTDQLDGETDWKVRLAVGACQKLHPDRLCSIKATVEAGEPNKDIYDFVGVFTMHDDALEGGTAMEPLGLENTLWADTVLASGSAWGVVVYTGKETRSRMNAPRPSSKVATLDLQVNDLSKILFGLLAVAALVMVAVPLLTAWGMQQIQQNASQRLLQALLDFACFILLFSQIIPISLRVALDMAKIVYKLQMTSDTRMPGLNVRTSTLPEELGGIQYLLTDKTGTLTQNEMLFRKLHLGFMCLTDGAASVEEVHSALVQSDPAHGQGSSDSTLSPAPSSKYRAGEAEASGSSVLSRCRSRSRDLMPNDASGWGRSEGPAVWGQSDGASGSARFGESSFNPASPANFSAVNSPQNGKAPAASHEEEELDDVPINNTRVEYAIREALLAIALCHNVSPVQADGEAFQGASPDELALVQFAATCGLRLVARTPTSITLTEPSGRSHVYEVLHEMPFSSALRRMGILLRDTDNGQIVFYVKGADSVMAERVERSDWLEEEVGNLAREGLRTLVVACKELTTEQYEHFRVSLDAARLTKLRRAEAVQSVLEQLQEDMQLLCITAVEDKLQVNVRTTLEMLRDANVRTWMLTGDKLETAKIVAQNSSLVARYQPFYTISVHSAAEARQQLNGYPQGSINSPCLILDGESLQLCVAHHQRLFMEVACAAPTVICCRCAPTQKAEVVRLIRQHTRGCTAAIGDGGNDVGMIHAAHVGIGVEGREGRQAALAADFSITQFSHLSRLVLWHGRNCYLRSATLSQFVIHRGLIISFIQAVFSALFYYRPIPLYDGVLVLGYATIFTTGPVFSLVLDEDVSEMNALKFPLLYRELQKRRYLSIKTFLMWTWKALYQGGVIMLGGVLLFEQRFVHVVAITFTSLILNENIMVAVEVKRWHPLMLLAQVLTLLVYICCIVALSSPALLGADFDIQFMLSVPFAWRVATLTFVSTLPVWLEKVYTGLCAPRVTAKLS